MAHQALSGALIRTFVGRDLDIKAWQKVRWHFLSCLDFCITPNKRADQIAISMHRLPSLQSYCHYSVLNV